LNNLEESVLDGGEVGLIVEFNNQKKTLEILECTIPKEKHMTKEEKLEIYLSSAIKESSLENDKIERLQHYLNRNKDIEVVDEHIEKAAVYTKYKPVALKVKPLYTDLPAKYRIIRKAIH